MVGEAPFLPPEDAAKAYRVVQQNGAWVPVSDVPNNLPATRNAFFRRFSELRELSDRLRTQRLVTLLGPGGTDGAPRV